MFSITQDHDSMQARYLHIKAEARLPDSPIQAPFSAVVVIETTVSTTWREAVSRWLVAGGCLYMMAWGVDCALWDDSVDYASLERVDFGDIPDSSLIMTTWHADWPLDKVFRFAQHQAKHPVAQLQKVLIVDIRNEGRRDALLSRFARAGERDA